GPGTASMRIRTAGPGSGTVLIGSRRGCATADPRRGPISDRPAPPPPPPAPRRQGAAASRVAARIVRTHGPKPSGDPAPKLNRLKGRGKNAKTMDSQPASGASPMNKRFLISLVVSAGLAVQGFAVTAQEVPPIKVDLPPQPSWAASNIPE